MTNTQEITEIWARLTDWFNEADEYFIEETFNPPADEEALSELEELIGAELPADLKASLLVYGGCAFDTFQLIDQTWALLSAEAIAQFYRDFQESQDVDSSLLPIARSGGGDYLLLNAQTGELQKMVREGGDLSTLAPDYLSWLRSFCEEVESGSLEIDEGAGLYRS